MSKQMRWYVMALGLLLPAADAQGQQSGRAREIQAQLDSLMPVLKGVDSVVHRLNDSIKAAETARTAEKLDTAMVGPLTVVARPDVIGKAERYVAGLWRDLEITMRGAESALRGTTFLIESGDGVPLFRTMSAQPHHVVLRMPVMLTESARRVHIMRALGNQLTRVSPTEVREWLNGTVLSWEDDMDANVYRELATARAQAASRCFLKEMAGCKAALGLAKPDSLWASWYSPAQLRQIVAENRVYGDAIRAKMVLRGECLGGAVESCAAYLRTGVGVPWPLTETVRVSFLTYALNKGGPGSFARLLTAQGDIANRIATAAGQPIDQVVAGWRNQIQEARPDVHAGVTRSRMAILFWILLSLGLAMRSTEWRIA